MTPTKTLTRAECNALRGLAIIGIVLHNYCHWLGPMVKENEYQFFQMNVDRMHVVLSMFNASLPLQFFSFFGHYGVPVFLFLSAFGLVKKYERSTQAPSVGTLPFVRYHYLKLFKIMIVGFVAFTMVDAITPDRFHYTVTDILAQLALVNNILPTPDKVIWPGPYWFFGLMLQLYVVYRLVFYRWRGWGVAVAAMVIMTCAQWLMDPEGEAINRYRYNFMGGILPFCFGLLYARYEDRIEQMRSRMGAIAFDSGLTILSALGILISEETFIGWSITPLFVCTFSIGLVRLTAALPAVLSALEWTGSISAALFVCHPITRKIFIPISRQGDLWTGFLLYIVASVCLAWLFRLLLSKIPNPTLKV